MFARRRRRDAEAYQIWRQVSAWTDPPTLPPTGRRDWRATSTQPMVGWVTHSRVFARGTKAFVDFGRHLGTQDTWWPRDVGIPAPRTYVVVCAHLWRPPGTHSGDNVLWIDECRSTIPARIVKRANRHVRRQREWDTL
jgi:hypothetical protein